MSKMRGYTLVEWMIAIVLGLFLLGGLLSLYVISKGVTKNSLGDGELQENARVAMRLLTSDLRMAGFWGDFTGTSVSRAAGASLSTLATTLVNGSDCTDAAGVGAFPTGTQTLGTLSTVPVSALSVKASGLACISLASGAAFSANTDILDIRRAGGSSVADATSLDTAKYYVASNHDGIYFFDGSETRPTLANMPNRQVWEYVRHIYYVAMSGTIPQLRMISLGDSYTDSLLATGIEKVRILLAVDTSTDADGIVDNFVRPETVTSAQWTQNRVLGARVFVLARSKSADANYTNAATYNLGDVSYKPADSYRRLLLQSTIMFNTRGETQ